MMKNQNNDNGDKRHQEPHQQQERDNDQSFETTGDGKDDFTRQTKQQQEKQQKSDHRQQPRRRGEDEEEDEDISIENNNTTNDVDDDDPTITPGALAITGINHDGYEDDLHEEYNNEIEDDNNNNNNNPNTMESDFVVAENVDEEALAARYASRIPTTEEVRQRIELEATRATEIVKDKNNDDANSTCRKRLMYILGAQICLIVIIIVVVLIVILLSPLRNEPEKEDVEQEPLLKKNITESPTQTPINTIEYFQELFQPISGNEVYNISTYQYQAIEWLFNETTINTTQEEDEDVTEDDESINTFVIDRRNYNVMVDRYGLAALYFATDGPNWKNSTNFLIPNLSACEWQYITCDVTGSVVVIDIVSKDLNGIIPLEIGYITFLERINLLFHDDLSGTLPDSIGKLNYLEFFQIIGSPNMIGTIPESFTNLTNLEIFALWNSGFTGTVPNGIWILPNLENLRLDNNKLTGTIPSLIFNKLQRRMSTMSLTANLLHGTIPTTINNTTMPNLEEFNFGDNMLTGTIPSEVFTLSKLSFLHLHGNQLSGTISTMIGNLNEYLISLDMFDNMLTGTIPTEFGLLTELDGIYSYRNLLSGTFPSEMGNLKKLRGFSYSFNTNLNGTIPSTFAMMTSLVFTVSRTSISGSLDSIFCPPYQEDFIVFELEADCGSDDGIPTIQSEVTCSCCTRCCIDTNLFCFKDTAQICNNYAGGIELWGNIALEDEVINNNNNHLENITSICECSNDSRFVQCNFLNFNEQFNNTNNTDKVEIITTDDCLTCNEDNTICGTTRNYGYELTFLSAKVDKWTNIFEYTVGRNDIIYWEHDLGSAPKCKVGVNGAECKACSFFLCADGYNGIYIDCTNIYDDNGDSATTNATNDNNNDGTFHSRVYNSCFPSDETRGSIFEVFSWLDNDSGYGCPLMFVTRTYSPKP